MDILTAVAIDFLAAVIVNVSMFNESEKVPSSQSTFCTLNSCNAQLCEDRQMSEIKNDNMTNSFFILTV